MSSIRTRVLHEESLSLSRKLCLFIYLFFARASAHTDAAEVTSKVSERVNSLQCVEANRTFSNSPRGTGLVALTKEHKSSFSATFALTQPLIDAAVWISC